MGETSENIIKSVVLFGQEYEIVDEQSRNDIEKLKNTQQETPTVKIDSLGIPVYTKEKLDFYDELFDKHIKIKKFKEDDLPFTKSKILPEIIWQKVENDIKTDDEQMSDAKEKLMNWLGDGIKLLKKDPKYFNEHIKKTHKGKSH